MEKRIPIGKFWSKASYGGVLAWLVIGSAVALMIANWSWVFLVRASPLPSTLVESGPDRLAKKIQGRHLFGMTGGIAGAISAMPETTQMILAGVVSSGSVKRGVAIIIIEGKKAVTARVGQEVVQDVILTRVANDHVELTRRGQTINLRLATKK